MNTKWLISLSAAQTVLLAALGLKVFAIDARTEEIAEAAAHPPQQQETGTDIADLSWDNARASSISADEVRMILREELAALETPTTSDNVRTAAAPKAKPQQTPKQIHTLQTGIQQDLNQLKGAGLVFAADLAEVEAKIAKLPTTERRAALSMLAKAIASGEIDARL